MSRVKDAELFLFRSFLFLFFFFLLFFNSFSYVRYSEKWLVDRPNSGSFSFLSAEERQARAASYELFEAIHPRTLCSLSRRRGYFEKKSTCALESLLFTFFFFFSVQAVRVEKILLLSFFLFFPFFFLVLVLDRLVCVFLVLLSFLCFFFSFLLDFFLQR